MINANTNEIGCQACELRPFNNIFGLGVIERFTIWVDLKKRASMSTNVFMRPRETYREPPCKILLLRLSKNLLCHKLITNHQLSLASYALSLEDCHPFRLLLFTRRACFTPRPRPESISYSPPQIGISFDHPSSEVKAARGALI